MVMNNGEIVEMADSDEIYRHPKQEYTRRLLSSIPKGLEHAAGAA
jgi:peptide/nickel transport system ATP-binding protein